MVNEYWIFLIYPYIYLNKSFGEQRISSQFYTICADERSSRSEVFCKKDILRNFAKFTGKQLCQSLFLNKVASLRPATLLKKSLWHRCFPLNFSKFLRTLFFTEHLRWLLFWWIVFTSLTSFLKSYAQMQLRADFQIFRISEGNWCISKQPAEMF